MSTEFIACRHLSLTARCSQVDIPIRAHAAHLANIQRCARTHAHICFDTHEHMNTRVHVHTRKLTHTFNDMHVGLPKHTHIHARTHEDTQTHTQIHARAYTHTHIRTHTRTVRTKADMRACQRVVRARVRKLRTTNTYPQAHKSS